MWKIRTEIKWNRYWDRVALWETIYHTLPSWYKMLMEKCRCKCWNIKFVQRSMLLRWRSKWCWCMSGIKWSKRMKPSHWMTWTKPYYAFNNAVARCTKENNLNYCRYGWRWIKMLRKDFTEFWNDMWESYYEHVKQFWEKNTTLDRINVNWNYCKENCRWATWEEQCENRRDDCSIVYKWKQYPTIARMCKEVWVNYKTVRERLRLGWQVEDAVETPLLKNNEKYSNKKRRKTKRDFIPLLW